MKTIKKFTLLTSLIACFFFISCKDDDHFNPEDYKTTAELNAEKILSYHTYEAAFKCSSLTLGTQQQVRPFKIEIPFITFKDEGDNSIALPLDNLLNISYMGTSKFLTLYFE